MYDLDEIILTPRRSGSAKKIRAGRLRLFGGLLDKRRPRWKRQLSGIKASHARKANGRG